MVSGSMQATSTAPPDTKAAPAGKPTGSMKKNRASTWKQKLQVYMLEKPGAVIGFACPSDLPAPLPFVVNAIKRSDVFTLERAHLNYLFDMVPAKEAGRVKDALRAEHNLILDALKTRDTKALRDSANEQTARSVAPEPVQRVRDMDIRRLKQLETDVSDTAEAMAALVSQAKQLPKLVAALRAKLGDKAPVWPPASNESATQQPLDERDDTNTDEVDGMGRDDLEG